MDVISELKDVISELKDEPEQHVANNDVSLAYFTSAFDLPADHWSQMVKTAGDFLLSVPYLINLEKHPFNDMYFHYVIAYFKNTPVGILYFQETEIHITDGYKMVENSSTSFLEGWVHDVLHSLKLRLLVNGNLFMSGPHGAHFLPIVPVDAQASIIQRACQKIIKSSRSGKKIMGMLIKDIGERLEKTLIEIDSGLIGFEVQPTMVIPIRKKWGTFGDVMDDYKSKYRVRTRGALKKAAHLNLQELDENSIGTLNNHMMELYKNVEGRSNFYMMSIHPRYFLEMKKALKDCFVVKGFFEDKKLVGFYSYFRGTGENLASFIGMDYEYNKLCSLYQNILYALLDDAIRDGADSLDLARTALEIKSTVGAEPVNHRLIVKHNNQIFNSVIKKLIQNLKPVQWIQRRPFRKNVAVQEVPVLHLTRSSS